MNNKSLIIDCHFSEGYNEIPVFVVNLIDGFKERIKDYRTSIELLRELHADNSIYKIQIFDLTPIVLNIEGCTIFENLYNFHDQNNWKIVDGFKTEEINQIRMDSILLEITDTYFRWSGLKKNTNIRITTKEIHHEEFLKDFCFDNQ